jgi:hypothetical protein
MHKTRILVAILFTLASLQLFAQKPDYSGTWVLNLEKSKLESAKATKITKVVFIIRQEGNKFKLTRYHYFGDKSKKLSIKMMADGQTRKMKLLFKSKLEWMEDHLKASIWRNNFSNIVSYRFGENNNEFIADEVFTSSSQNYHNYWVFERDIRK